MITIVNYGLGNLGSIANMFKRISEPCEITSNLEKITEAKKILLPGVGSFDAAMNMIRNLGLEQILKKKALEEKVPFLGICLGMQLLTDCSEEGNLLGLGLIKGKAIRFQFNDKLLKIPHMGWNRIHFKNSSPLLFGMEEEQKFYFAHSYYVVCHHRENVIAQTSYGHDFDSIIQSGNVLGAQFHPERSHRYGMRLLKNFAMI